MNGEIIHEGRKNESFNEKIWKVLLPTIVKGLYELLSWEDIDRFLNDLKTWKLTKEQRKYLLYLLNNLPPYFLKYNGWIFENLPIKWMANREKMISNTSIKESRLEEKNWRFVWKIRFWHDHWYYPIWETKNWLETIPFEVRKENNEGLVFWMATIWNKERPIFLRYTFWPLWEVIWFGNKYIKIRKYIVERYWFEENMFLGKLIKEKINEKEWRIIYIYLLYYNEWKFSIIKLSTLW